MANFTSLEFLFRFLPIFLAVYYLVPPKLKNPVLLIGSLVFYAFGSPIFIGLLIVLILLNYLFAHFSFKKVPGAGEAWRFRRRRQYMFIAIGIDILVIVGFKVAACFFDASIWPLGLSFFIFKMISFQIDILRQTIVLEPSLIQTATYFAMFPQISQGPLMRYEDAELFNEKHPSLERIEDGLKYFIIGMAMKVLLADRIGILWNDLGMYGYQSISTPLAWLGAVAYSLELYFDFWGYSLMSSGIMLALGFEFVTNFKHPYASTTISEFYQRWHVTLGGFFRDYVYIPMGGSRVDRSRLVLNLMAVWLLTGIWHGNGLNFVLWGIVLGILIVLEKCFYGQLLKKCKVLGHIYVIILIPLSWVIFAISDIRKLGIYFGRLFPIVPTTAVVNSQDIIKYLGDYWWMLLIGIILCIPSLAKWYERFKNTWVVRIALIALFWISIYFSASTAGNPFMYLNF